MSSIWMRSVSREKRQDILRIKINALFEDDEEDEVVEEEKTYPPYDKDKFIEEVFIDEESYNSLVGPVIVKYRIQNHNNKKKKNSNLNLQRCHYERI